MLKKHKNKKFNYTSRFSDDKEVTEADVSKEAAFVSKWQRSRKVNSNRKGLVKGFSMRMLIIILVLLLICMYVLDF